jgi:tetratricopeptide (TPR) repeat protein
LQAYQRLASVYQKTSKVEDARAICLQAVELWDMVGDPKLKFRLAPTIYQIKFEEVLLDMSLEQNTVAESSLRKLVGFLEIYQKGFSDEELRAFTFDVDRHIGLTLIAQSKNTEASGFLRDAWQATVSDLKVDPTNRAAKQRHSLALQDLGEHARRMANTKEALRFFESAIEQLEEVKDGSMRFNFREAYLLSDVAATNATLGNPEKAEMQFERSLKLLENLREAQPENTSYSKRLTHTLLRQGKFLESIGDPEFALRAFEKALADILSQPQGSRNFNDELDIRARLGALYNAHLKDVESSLELLEGAANIGEEAVVQDPDAPLLRNSLAKVYDELSNTRSDARDQSGAFVASRKAAFHFNSMIGMRPNVEWIEQKAKQYAQKASRIAMELGEYEFAAELIVESAGYVSDSPETHYDTARQLAGIHAFLSDIKRSDSQSPEKLRDLQLGIERKAIGYLSRAIKHGFGSESIVRRHSEWDSLRSNTEFRRLIRSMN